MGVFQAKQNISVKQASVQKVVKTVSEAESVRKEASTYWHFQGLVEANPNSGVGGRARVTRHSGPAAWRNRPHLTLQFRRVTGSHIETLPQAAPSQPWPIVAANYHEHNTWLATEGWSFVTIRVVTQHLYCGMRAKIKPNRLHRKNI